MRRLLHLQHHKHTGKVLAHHQTSYRGLLVVLVVLGIALASIQQAAQAADLAVFAKVSAPMPTVPAVIQQPTDGTTVTEADITVAGTCQFIPPVSIVAIYIGAQPYGSTPCQSGGRFSLVITLPAGTGSLVARTANATEDYGPDSAPVAVTYTPLASPGTGSGGHSVTPTVQPLRIKSQPTYLVFGRWQPARWKFAIEGGRAPYMVTIDWGDGQTQLLTIKDTDLHEATHTYKTMRDYFATLSVVDAGGARAQFTAAAITPYKTELYSAGPVLQVPFLQTLPGTLVLSYAAYLLLLIIFGLSWYDIRHRHGGPRYKPLRVHHR